MNCCYSLRPLNAEIKITATKKTTSFTYKSQLPNESLAEPEEIATTNNGTPGKKKKTKTRFQQRNEKNYSGKLKKIPLVETTLTPS